MPNVMLTLFEPIRFIPEDMTFDQKPTSVAKSMPLEGTYEPPEFENKALHCTDVSRVLNCADINVWWLLIDN